MSAKPTLFAFEDHGDTRKVDEKPMKIIELPVNMSAGLLKISNKLTRTIEDQTK